MNQIIDENITINGKDSVANKAILLKSVAGPMLLGAMVKSMSHEISELSTIKAKPIKKPLTTELLSVLLASRRFESRLIGS
jgi:hypothetical protein